MLSSKLVKKAVLKIYPGGSDALGDTSKEQLNADLLMFLGRRRSGLKVEENPYVFPGQNSTGHLQNMKRTWDRIRVKAGIPDVRFHDLRRTVGSWLAGSGESLQLIGKVLNHRDVSTTAIYARLNLNPVRQALERNASKMLEAAAPPRIPAVRRKSKKRLRSMRNPVFHELEPVSSESG